VIEDCEEAIKLQPGNIKAYFRAARACNGLHKYARAVDFCDEGLKREEGSAELGKEKAVAQEGLRRREDEAKRKQAQVAPPRHGSWSCSCWRGAGAGVALVLVLAWRWCLC
jgi:hypothetical protein